MVIDEWIKGGARTPVDVKGKPSELDTQDLDGLEAKWRNGAASLAKDVSPQIGQLLDYRLSKPPNILTLH